MGFDDGIRASLDNLKGGAAIQLFNEELDKVLANIMDPNTEAEVGREVVLKVKIKPDKDRSTAAVTIIPSSKLAPTVSVPTRFFLGKKGTQMLAYEHDPEQLSFPMSRGDFKAHAGGKDDSGPEAGQVKSI
jgi:hypothetical protein